jgi:hypothetical protein
LEGAASGVFLVKQCLLCNEGLAMLKES